HPHLEVVEHHFVRGASTCWDGECHRDGNATQLSGVVDASPKRYRRLRNLEINRRISIYSQMSVTIRPNAPYHSMYFGAPRSAPDSMKSKSRTRFIAATPTTTRLNAIPIGPEP